MVGRNGRRKLLISRSPKAERGREEEEEEDEKEEEVESVIPAEHTSNGLTLLPGSTSYRFHYVTTVLEAGNDTINTWILGNANHLYAYLYILNLPTYLESSESRGASLV